jgi:hypothetical protein
MSNPLHWAVAKAVRGSYIPGSEKHESPMRAEIQAIVDDIKQSMGLLRRHL